MLKSFGVAHREEAGAEMYNQLECTLTALPSKNAVKQRPGLCAHPGLTSGAPGPAGRGCRVKRPQGQCTRDRLAGFSLHARLHFCARAY